MEIINNFLWSIALVLLVLSGFYFGFKLNFLHLDIIKIFKSFKCKNNNLNGISPFESLSVSLGACIGVGSLSGIALAIFKGGVGTIFWILISCLIIAPNSLVENTLAVIYHRKDKKEYIGGPAYYIKYGLGYKKLAFIYASLIIISYLLGFLPIQANTISKAITSLVNIPSLLIGIVIGLISFLIIKKGLKGIAKFSSFFVPVMGILYIGSALFIIFKNINLMPNVFGLIFKEAFNFNSLKYGFFSVIIIGIQRGIFASEAGSGTSAIASASSNLNSPIKQGMISLIGVYFTTFVICLSTALIILTSNYSVINYSSINGIEITRDALVYHLGVFGNILLYFCLIAFSFSTIISGYFYIEANLKYIFKNINNNVLLFFKVLTCLFLIISTIISPSLIWNLADILVAILIIINVFAILNLKNDVIIEYMEDSSNDRK